tara:strand:+ start:103 stop:405 length:303 start_codon:yes stop_codon:yes gene_type:complete
MKKIIVLSFLIIVACQTKLKVSVLEAPIACGQCQFDLEGDGCNLAVKINDKAYFVEGFGIDDFGDAHDEQTGFCNVVRKAKIEGEIVSNKFVASSIKLIE